MPGPLEELKKFFTGGSEGRARVLGNISWLTAEWVILKLTLLAGSIILARYLGPSDFGKFGYSISVVQLFYSISLLGLTVIVVRDMVEKPSERGALLGTAFVLRVAGGLLGIAGVVVSVLVLRPGDRDVALLAGIMSVRLVLWSFEVFDFWFQSQVRSKYKVIANNSAMLMYLLAVIVLVLIEAPLAWFAVAVAVEALIYVIGLGIGYSRCSEGVGRWMFSMELARRLLREGWPYILSTIAIMLYMRVDQIMLGSLADDQAVGLYTVAVRISEGWYMVPRALAVSVFPALVAAKSMGDDVFYTRLGKGFSVLAVLSVSIAIAITFLAGPLVRLLFGDAYSDAAGILKLHIWSGVAVFLGALAERWCVIEREQKFRMYATAFGAGLNILLNFWLIPLYGGFGAAIATLVSYFCSDVLVYFVYKPSRRLAMAMLRAVLMPWVHFRRKVAGGGAGGSL